MTRSTAIEYKVIPIYFFCAIPTGIKDDLAIFLVNISRNNYSNSFTLLYRITDS